MRDQLSKLFFKSLHIIIFLFFRYLVMGNKSNSIHFGFRSFNMREVHGSHVLIIQIFYWQIRKSSSICELDSCQINFFPHVIIVNVIFSPLLFPFLSFQSNRIWSWHLYSFTNRKIWSCFLIKESQYFIFHINRSTCELNSC